MEQKSIKKSHNYCFTYFNYGEISAVESKLKDKGATYYVFGREICPTTNKPHLQGYVHWKTPREFEAVRKYITGWSVRICSGNAEQNFNYCTKEDKNYIEWGEKPKQGKRTDLNIIKKSILIDGKDVKDIIMDDEIYNYQQLRFAEGLLKYKSLKKETIKREVYWIWGPTGVGKSKYAFDNVSNDYWISGKNLKWFDGYYGQKDVIIDDFRADFCTFHELIRLLDIYPMRVEVKGSSVIWNATRIFITSCYPPDGVYKTREDIAQLYGRITKEIYMDGINHRLVEQEQKSGVILSPDSVLPTLSELYERNDLTFDDLPEGEVY